MFLVGGESSSGYQTLLSLMTDEECQDICEVDPHFDARKVPYLMYSTSGTTGPPKLAVQSQHSFTFTKEQLV